MRSQRALQSLLKYAALVLLIPGLLVLFTALPLAATSIASQGDGVSSTPSQLAQTALDEAPRLAQRVRPLEVWQQVYDRLPDLPREDQYISSETGQRATSSTLISRLVRYHTFIRGRSPNYRFDWKLTLADYLGVNELIRSASYPGHDTLTANPMTGDIEVVRRFTRAQRAALVDTLVAVFTTPSGTDSPNPTPSNSTPRPSASPTPRPPASPPPVQPRPGDAQLLQL